MDGLKKRWFTERTSTLTRPPPTTPSAAPNPVMLRIISSGLSYGTTTRLSIPEIPSHAIELRLTRHLEARNQPVPLLEHVTELIGHDCRLNADLQSEGDDANIGDADQVPIEEREPNRGAVVVSQRSEEAEVSPRESIEEVRLDVQLAPRLVARTKDSRRVAPRESPGIGVERLVQATPHTDQSPGRLALGPHPRSRRRAGQQVVGSEQRRRHS